MTAIALKNASPILASHPVAKKILGCAAARLRKDFNEARRLLCEAELVLARSPVEGGLKACRTAKKILSMEERAHDVRQQIRADRRALTA